MITTPSKHMTGILVKAGLSEQDISVGQNGDSRINEISLSWTDYRLTLLAKDRQTVVFSKGKDDKAFSALMSMLHVNVPMVAIDLADLSTLFPGDIHLNGQLVNLMKDNDQPTIAQ